MQASLVGFVSAIGSREMDQIFDHFFGPVTGESSTPVYAPKRAVGRGKSLGFGSRAAGHSTRRHRHHAGEGCAANHRGAGPGEDGRKFVHQERAYGKVQRLIKLPDTVDPDNIEAELKDGVLRLYLKKRPELQPKKIQVKTA